MFEGINEVPEEETDSCSNEDSDSMVGLDDSYFESVLQKNIELWKSAAKEEKIKLFENELIT